MQQFFCLLILLNQRNMFRATESPILGSTFWMYIQLLVQCTDTAVDRCHRGTGRQQRRCIVPKSCTYRQKVLLRMRESVARNILGWFKRINKRKRCCILLVIYIVLLKWCTVTQTSSSFICPMKDFSGTLQIRHSDSTKIKKKLLRITFFKVWKCGEWRREWLWRKFTSISASNLRFEK